MTEVLPMDDKNLAAIQLVLPEVIPPVPADPSRATLDPPTKLPLVAPPDTNAEIVPPLTCRRLAFCPGAPPLLPPEPALFETNVEHPKP